MADLPILVSKYVRDQVRTLGCSECGAERLATDDEIGQCDGLGSCETDDCGGYLEWKYMEADRCPNCQTLGFYEQALDYCCTRACQLQAQYAKELGESAA